MTYTTETDAPVVCALSTRSPAKINLTLDVLGRRSDGFHEIRSVALGVDYWDELRFERADHDRVCLGCDRRDLPGDDRNLIVQAANRLKAAVGAPELGVHITMSKRIPIASGLGGGSGNAAVTLMALNRLWGTGLSPARLASIGSEIGSDVALFFALPSARITGRGERVAPVEMRWSGWVVLAFAGCPVSTREVYAAWAAVKPEASGGGDGGRGLVDDTGDVVAARSAEELSQLCRNALEPAVFEVAPAVRTLVNAARSCGAAYPRVTGAGQTVYTLFDDADEAEVFRLKLKTTGACTGAVVCRTLTAPMMI